MDRPKARAQKPPRPKASPDARGHAAADPSNGSEEQARATLSQALTRASRLLNDLAVSRLRAKNPEFRASHARLLPQIDPGGTRLTALADRMGVTKQAAGQLVEELEGQGLLTREPDPDDRRARRVKLTARGKKSVVDGLALLGSFEAALASKLGAERTGALEATLVEVSAWLEAESSGASD